MHKKPYVQSFLFVLSAGALAVACSKQTNEEDEKGNIVSFPDATTSDVISIGWDADPDAKPGDGAAQNQCSNCIALACPTEYDKCTSNPDCGAILDCVNRCFWNYDDGDKATRDKCLADCYASWDGGTAASALTSGCLSASGSCKSACGR